MACACKVNQEINKIAKYYSYNKEKETEKKIRQQNAGDIAKTVLIYLLILPLLPIMFIGVLIFSIFSKDKKISMRKFLGFIHKARNGRKQQNIQNQD